MNSPTRATVPRNYSRARHYFEETLGWLGAGGWSAELALRLGLQAAPGVCEYVVESAAFPASAPPLRIAFATDFHSGPVTHPSLLEAACETLAAIKADMLLLGGDFVSHRAHHVVPLARLLSQVPVRLGKFAVLGNHDHWAGARQVADPLEDNGIRLLSNCNVALAGPYSGVSVCGLDDHSSGHPDAEAAFTGAGALRILLMHSPSGLLDVGAHDFRLSLSGHTHGGQIALPGGYAPYVPVGALSRQFVYGRYRHKDSTVIVSRGVGCSTLPVRVLAPAEIVVVTLCARRPTD